MTSSSATGSGNLDRTCTLKITATYTVTYQKTPADGQNKAKNGQTSNPTSKNGQKTDTRRYYPKSRYHSYMRCMNNSHSTAKPLIHAQEHKMNPRLLVKETMYQTWKNHPETYPVNMMAQIEQNDMQSAYPAYQEPSPRCGQQWYLQAAQQASCGHCRP